MQRVVVAVDDDPAILASVAETLEGEGIKVVTFKSALPALSWLVDNPTDLIIVDFVMPRMNGYHFMRVLEARHLAPEAPVLLLSSLTEKVGRRLQSVTRVEECIAKPFTSDELLIAVQRHLGTKRMHRPEVPEEKANPSLALGPDESWIQLTVCRERLIGALWEGFAQRAEQIAETNSIESVYQLFSEILYSTLSEEFVESFLILSDKTEKD